MNPMQLTPKEWDEVATVPAVQSAWGLEPSESGATFAELAYVAKFNLVNGPPGYVGDLYLIMDYTFGGAPMVLSRRESDQRLERVHFE